MELAARNVRSFKADVVGQYGTVHTKREFYIRMTITLERTRGLSLRICVQILLLSASCECYSLSRNLTEMCGSKTL